jgi:SulP family sulfate permease
MYSYLYPKLYTLYKNGLITKKQISKDIMSGIIVGIVALPLAIAFAIASGVSPEKGLVTAIVAGFIISAFGGSRVQIGGPTGAFIVIVYAIVQEHGVEGLVIATFMAGFIIIGMGLAKVGNWLKYIPYPLIVGFTSGIALIILSSQIKDFFGLTITDLPSDFVGKWQVYIKNFNGINWIAVTLAVGTVLISFNFHRITSKVPGSLVAIILSILIVKYFHLPVETIESKFGEIPNSFSMPSIPIVNFGTIQALIQPAFAIALLGAIESLLSAVVSDGMIGSKHRPNAELIAQGSANIVSALFAGIPATGAIARTATNVKNGGRTPIAGIVHTVVLLLIMLVFAPYAKLIPMATLAGILIVVSYHMSEWRQFSSLVRTGKKGDITVLLVTFFLTVVFDLIIAIEVGIVLSSFVLMKRISESVHVNKESDGEAVPISEKEILFDQEIKDIPHGVSIYQIEGPLFFGASQLFEETLNQLKEYPEILILRMRHLSFVDSTGIQRLKEMVHKFSKNGVKIIFSGMNTKVKHDLKKAGIIDVVEEENCALNVDLALGRANQILAQKN